MLTACRAFLVALLLLLAGAAHAAETWRHTVLRDGEPVGASVLRFEREGGQLVVTTNVHVRVVAAFFTLYEYRYAGREVWRGDQLIALETQTDDNGRRMAVSGRLTPGGFTVEGPEGAATVPPDIWPTSFWREDAVARRRLLDSETGRVVDIASAALSLEGAQRGALTRYRVAGELKNPLELTYAEGRLVSARLRKMGSEIEFRAENASVPSQLATAGSAGGG